MSSKSSNSGVGPTCLLGIVFITLKLTGFIGWSWWWVLAPFWGPLAVIVFICLIVSAVVLGSAFLKAAVFGVAKRV